MTGPLVAVGDLFVDLVADLGLADPPVSFGDLSSSSNCFACIDTWAGGSALHVASAAVGAGFASGTVIGSIGGLAAGGPDAEGQFLVREAAVLGVGLLVAISPTSATGRVLALYSGRGERLLVSDRGANADLCPEDLTQDMFLAVREAAAVHVSGYTLLQPQRREAVKALAVAAREGGALVALDYAPHDLHMHLPPSELIDAIAPFVDCAFVELPLAARLAGEWTPSGAVNVPAVLAWWGSRFEHAVIHVTPGRAILRSAGRDRTIDTAYAAGTRSRGQSARVQAEILGLLWADGPRPPRSGTAPSHAGAV
jgi:sugar/nucleoside kinase (ribokinase family)